MSALAELARRAAAGDTCALATVVGTEGSSPAEPAMKMVVGPAGRLAGTIGGGHVEAAVEAKAREVLAGGAPEILSFTLDDDLADDAGMICGGTMRVLVERVEPPAPWAAAALELLGSGRRGVIVAHIGDGVARETLRGPAADAHLASEDPRLTDDNVFVEPLITPRCIILGAGHVGRAVARIARVAGLYVAVVEDRPDQAEKADGLCDEVVCADLVAGFGELDPSPDDYVVVMTRGHGLDLNCVRAALNSPARYVGMLASRKKTKTIRAALAAENVAAGERLHAPIGLDLGAASAGEIAVSVVAQLVKVRRLGRGDR